MQEMSTASLIFARRLAHNYRKGTTLLPSLNFKFKFNPLLSASLPAENNAFLFHTQISTNPNPNPNPNLPDRSQLPKLLLEKSKLGFDKLDDALSLLHRMLQMQTLPPVIHFNHLLNGIVKMKHYSTVISLFQKMRLLGIRANDYTLNVVINCLCHLNRVDYGFSLLGVFFKCGYVPGLYTYSTLMTGFILDDKTGKALELFKKMVKEKEIKPWIIINGLCEKENTTTAIGVLKSMLKWNYKPNVVMYNIIIDSLCNDRNVDDALRLFVE